MQNFEGSETQAGPNSARKMAAADARRTAMNQRDRGGGPGCVNEGSAQTTEKWGFPIRRCGKKLKPNLWTRETEALPQIDEKSKTR